jgi:pimeloyl-ACP methyl ester carboxylesterase
MKKILGWFWLLMPSIAYAQSESFIMRAGADTIAIETFVLDANRLEGELGGRAVQGRMRYAIRLNAGLPEEMRLEVFAPRADTPSIRVLARYVGDSAIVDVTRAGATSTQRLASRAGAFPYVNLAPSFMELAMSRAQRTVGDTANVWYFVIGAGQTLPAKFHWNAPDSAVVSIGGVELRLHLDARGRILHGNVPTQNVTIERVAGTLNRGADAEPDYSAPPNASYTAENVTVRTPAGHTLAGTLTLPKQRSGKIPVVITISGSGPQDRDEALLILRGYRPFRELAEALAARGIATLRYDDRGFGGSTGVHASATSADFADDTRAVVAYSKSRPELDANRVFLVGHSEGGMIAPMVAAQDPTLRGIVLLAGPGWTGRKILEYQTRNSVDLQSDKTAAQRDSLYRIGLMALDSVTVNPGWVRYFAEYDPLPVVRKVRAPVLIVHGATDRQVTAEQAEILGKTLRAAGNTDVAVHVLPDVNHLFLSDPVGHVAGYGTLSKRMVVPQLLQLVTDWIVNQSK